MSVSVFTFLLNGETVRVDEYSPRATLLDFVRERGLTGAKEGCGEGECGACTVVLVKPGDAGSEYRAVNSCLMFLPMTAGQEVYTVEALAARGELHPVQRAIAERGGSQCGYCTPGFVMSLFAEHYRPSRAGACDPDAMGGNLCRCTGYRPLRDAALSLTAAPSADDAFHSRLAQPAPELTAVATAGFSRPSSLAECLRLLRDDPASRLVAGGTDLAVESNLRGRVFPRLISTEVLAELRMFHDAPEHVEIGAGLALSEIGSRWKDAPPVIAEWLPLFASPLIRNRATLGGNLGTASPIGDAAPLLLALDARLRIASAAGDRIVPLSSYFLAYRRTALEAGEMLTSVIVPKPFPRLARFYKASKRRLDDISTVAACFSLGHNGDARICYGGVAAVPVRVPRAEEALAHGDWRGAGEIVARTLHPMTDHRGSAAYRLALAQSLLRRFEGEAREQAA